MKKVMSLFVTMLLAAGLLIGSVGCAKPEEFGEIPLRLLSTDENEYAEHYKIERYEEDVTALTLYDQEKKISGKFLLKGKDSGFSEEVEGWTTLEVPLTNVLVASTPAMSLIAASGGLSGVSMTETVTWYIDSVNEAIAAGDLVSVGKLSGTGDNAWQSEVVISGQPSLAICSAMLPVKYTDRQEEFEDGGIPYLLDESTNEDHVMGRTEWIKVMGLLFGREDEAREVFDAQAEKYASILARLSAEKPAEPVRVAITYVTSKYVGYFRNPDDYIAGMLEEAGGENVCPEGGTRGENSTSVDNETYVRTLQEEVDVMLYNISLGGSQDSAIRDRIDSVVEWEQFKTFDVYKNKQIWVTERKLYQSMDCLADMMEDMYRVMYDPDVPDQLTFMHRLDLTQFD